MRRARRAHAVAQREIVAAARSLADQRLVVGTTGNVSARVGDRVWITPTRTPYDRLRPAALASFDLDTGRAAPTPVPSIELPVHVAVYRARPDVRAVVHCHSPHATAWSFLGRPLAPITEDLTYHGICEVQTCDAGPPGSPQLARSVARGLRAGVALLIAGHGVLTVASTVEMAVARAAAVEHVAQIAWLLRHEVRSYGEIEHAFE